MNLSSLIKYATLQLSNTSDTAKLDAEVLLCHLLKKDRSYLISWPEKEISADQLAQFETLIDKRQQGHPVAHLIQLKEFWSLNFQVNADTLIPRPETELIVEQVLHHYAESPAKSLLDLGTGSGAIAIAIASERPAWNITATDQSLNALKIAAENARLLGISNLQFKSGSWFAPLAQQSFDIIVSNPPYIAEDDPHLSQGDVRFEPDTALVSGKDGLDDIRFIVQHAPQHLYVNGMLIIEHGYDQKNAVHSLFAQAGFINIVQDQDLSGQPRTTRGIIN